MFRQPEPVQHHHAGVHEIPHPRPGGPVAQKLAHRGDGTRVVDGGMQRLEVRLVAHPRIGALDEREAFEVTFGDFQSYVGSD